MNPLLGPPLPGERFHVHTIPLHLVDRFVAAYGLKTFIETGTYLGLTIEHVQEKFENVYTIELDSKLAATARWKFEDSPKVHVLEGDSGKMLESLWVKDRALIWLDAHWSGGITAQMSSAVHTSIRAELSAIRRWDLHDHVLMVDDLDDFTGENGYPTIGGLIRLVKEINPSYEVELLGVRRGVLVALPSLNVA